MGANKLLLLRAPKIHEDLGGLLERLDQEPALRDLYLRDPAGVIQKFVFPDQGGVPSAEIARGNRLLYSLLSNTEFVQWAQEYEQGLILEAQEATSIEDPAAALNAYLTIVDRSRLHADLAEAVARTADAEVIGALTWRPDLPKVGATRLPIAADIAVDIETFIYAVAVAAVFAVAVGVVFIGVVPEQPDRLLSRADLLNVANQLSEDLIDRSVVVKEAGTLRQVAQRNIGFIR
jgi:hypothetical protein